MRAGPRDPPSAPPPARYLMRGCGKSPDVQTLEGVRARGRGAPGREQLRIEAEEHRSTRLGPSDQPHRCSTPAGMAKTAPAGEPRRDAAGGGPMSGLKTGLQPRLELRRGGGQGVRRCFRPPPCAHRLTGRRGRTRRPRTPVYELWRRFVAGAKLHPKTSLHSGHAHLHSPAIELIGFNRPSRF